MPLSCARDCCPPGKGCNRAGPSSREEAGVLHPLLHRTQERWWPSTNPGSASLNWALHKFKMRTRRRIIKCIQPQDWFAAIDLSLSRRRRPYPVTGSGRQDPQLPRRLAYPSPIQRAVGRSQGLGASAPQPVGASGSTGKRAISPLCRESLFSVWS